MSSRFGLAVTASPRAKRAGADESHAREATSGSDPDRLVLIRIRAGPLIRAIDHKERQRRVPETVVDWELEPASAFGP